MITFEEIRDIMRQMPLEDQKWLLAGYTVDTVEELKGIKFRSIIKTEDGTGFIEGYSCKRITKKCIEYGLFILIGVTPGCRGKGVSDKLVCELIDFARKNGYKFLEWTVDEDNKYSLAAAKRNGFKALNHKKPYNLTLYIR